MILSFSYRYDVDKNKCGKVISISCYYFINAVGANYINGFGVQFPFSPDLVKRVSGQRLKANYITLRANGTEAGTSNTIIFPFDDTRNLIQSHTSYNFINVRKNEPKSVSDTVQITITFKKPLDDTSIGKSSFRSVF